MFQLRGRLPYLPVLALEIANSLAMSDISVGWTQGSLSGSTPPSALPNSDNTSGALWGLIEARWNTFKTFLKLCSLCRNTKTLANGLATLSMDCAVIFSYLWVCTLVSAFSHCSLLACVTHSSRFKPNHHRGKEPISEVLNIGFQLPLSQVPLLFLYTITILWLSPGIIIW